MGSDCLDGNATEQWWSEAREKCQVALAGWVHTGGCLQPCNLSLTEHTGVICWVTLAVSLPLPSFFLSWLKNLCANVINYNFPQISQILQTCTLVKLQGHLKMAPACSLLIAAALSQANVSVSTGGCHTESLQAQADGTRCPTDAVCSMKARMWNAQRMRYVNEGTNAVCSP